MTAADRPRHPLTKPPLPRAGRGGLAAPPPDPRRDDLCRRVAVADHLAYVRAVLGRYAIARRAAPDVYQSLDRLAEYEGEPRLFLGVIGEFSSGKSTLLNALLRDDLLRADVRQGTTSAPTLLSFGPDLTVRPRPLPAHPVLRPFQVAWHALGAVAARFRARPRDRAALRAQLHDASAEEARARRLAQVNVTHPAECLRQGMVIVDLPGTNAANPRHGQVTAAALADFCDAALVVVPADAPGSETLWAFLQGHLEADVLRRCVFVLNKIDLIRRPKDRQQLVANLTARLQRDLKVDKPLVVTAAPELALEAAGVVTPAEGDRALTAGEKAQWSAAFAEAEAVLWATLREQKLLLQIERLARLLAQVFDRLTAVLQARDAAHQERHAALVAGLAQIPDLDGFVAEARARHVGAFRAAAAPLVAKGTQGLGRLQADTLRALSQAVFAAGNRKALQQALQEGVPGLLQAAQKDLRAMIGTTIRALEKAAEAEHRRFHGQFQELYRNLARLGGRVRTATRGLDARAAGKFAAGTGDAPASLASGVAQLRQEELWKTAGGAGLGAVVGTLMLPGVGTILGGAVGGLLSRLFGGPSHAEVQQRCWAQLEPAVVRGFEAFAAQAGDHLDHAVREIEAGLAAAVGRYAGQYRRLVDEMIARDEQAAAELANLSRAVRQELTDVRGRQEQLARARADLRAL